MSAVISFERSIIMAGFVFENDAYDPEVNIKVIGVGGGGGNALNCMADSGISDIEYIAVNTGAAPVVAQIAKEMDILTVAVVTKPFLFEREQKMLQAERGIAELRKYVDSLIVIPNEKLLCGLDKPLTMKESFSIADDILKTGVRSISDLITDDGFINLDFADVSTIMKGAGYAHMAIGHGEGKDKATDAAKAVISSPLLETSISGANRLLINIVMSEDVLAEDVDTATKMITDTAADLRYSVQGRHAG